MALPTSVVSYPTRGQGGSAAYRGNCAPQLVADLIDQYQPKMVVDPMAGSYTVRDVCEARGVAHWCGDLRDGFDLLNDEIPVGGTLGFLHPPYYRMVLYSGEVWGNEAHPQDLSRAADYESFLRLLDEAQYRLYESLRQGAHMAILVGDLKQAGTLYPLQRDMRWYGEPVNLVIKMQHNCWSDGRHYSGPLIRIVHEYLIITRKPGAWQMLVREGQIQTRNLRRFVGMRWRALVQAGLESLGGEGALADLYEVLSGHARVREAMQKGSDW